MKLLFLHKHNSYWDKKFEELKSEFKDLQILFINDKNSSKEKLLKEVDGIIGGFISEDEIDIAENLRIIFVPFAGVEQLPMKKLKEKNILVSNAHGNGKFVAERAVALALALLGKVIPFHNDLKNGVWHGFSVGESVFDSWISIQDKSIGILGFGAIGQNIAKFLKPFGVKINIFKYNKIDYLPKNVDNVFYNIDEVINESDILFLSLPLTEHTYEIINKERLMNMYNKYIVNVGRGRLISEEGLYLSLKEGILKGAALDVWFNYPTAEKKNVMPSKYPIWEFENVVLSPHVGGYSYHATTAGIDYTIDSIRSYIRNGKSLSIVDYNKEY